MATSKSRRSKGTPATSTLTAAGLHFTSHTYDHDPRVASFGLEAAEALGLPPSQVFKTLIALVDARPHVAVVPVDCTVDLKALATAAGGKRADMAPADLAQRLTGYVIGGISPIGQRTSLPTVVDSSARNHAQVYVSGGARGFDIGIDPADLVRITSAVIAPIATGPASRPAPAE
jgi:Cys-tRNA(Pro)/Cys-tRNA(Cys) deacylase